METRATVTTAAGIQAYLSQKGQARRVDRMPDEIIIGAFVSRFADKVAFSAESVEVALNARMAQFFQELTSYMGQEADLASMLPRSGVAPWKRLSPRYVSHKGNSKFWLYSSGMPTKSGKLRKGGVGGSGLIKELRGKSAARAFGMVKVRSGNKLASTDKETIRQDAGVTAANIARGRRDSYYYVADLWTGLTRSRTASFQNIEATLQTRGVLFPGQVKKLLNRKNAYRPLISPLMDYYARVALPAALREYLRSAGSRGLGGTERGGRPLNPPNVGAISRAFQNRS